MSGGTTDEPEGPAPGGGDGDWHECGRWVRVLSSYIDEVASAPQSESEPVEESAPEPGEGGHPCCG